MKAFLRTYCEAIQVVLGLVVAFSAAAGMVGQPARLVQLITLAVGTFGAGVGAGAAVAKRRARRTGNPEAAR